MIIHVQVLLKEEVLDPAGQATEHVLQQMGYPVSQVRIGKLVRLEVEAGSEDEAISLGQEMARRLLANPVMETYRVTVVGS